MTINQSTPSKEPLTKFLFSEALTVKAVFDNIRNYLICTTLFVIAVSINKVLTSKTGDFPDSLILNGSRYAIWVLAAIALVLNVGQTAAIIGAFFEGATKNGIALQSPRFGVRVIKVLVALTVLLAACFTLLGLLLAFAANIVVSAKIIPPI